MIVALGAHYLLGLRWELAVLLGAVTSPTDAAAVFSVLRVVPLPEAAHRRARGRVRPQRRPDGRAGHAHLDRRRWPSTACSTTSGVDRLRAGRRPRRSGWPSASAGAWVMRRAALPSSGLYPLAVLCARASWRTARPPAVHASGFAAVYVAALVLGNAELPAPRGHPVVRRGRGLAGPDRAVRDARAAALAGPDRPRDRRVRRRGRPGADPGRPAGLGRWSARSSSRCRWRELAFISWAGLRGAVPIVLATIPLAEGVDDSERLFDIVFVLVVDLHPAHRADAAAGRQGAAGGPALRAARPRHRGGAARAGRRRPAAGDDQPGLEDARRRGRRAPAARRARRCR